MGKNDLLRKLANRIDLNDEVLPGVPLVEMIGFQRILIENHRGVKQFGREQITVCVKYGLLCVSGRCLELRKMSHCQLIISGQIEQLTVIRGNEG